MSSLAITTVVKMMESLPEDIRCLVAEHLCDLQDELQWEETFRTSQSKLVAAAKVAKKEIAEGLVMD